ncbi:Protein FAM32A [Babesia duncani]|uniref:Protein FAM32A n=1 Tax=Babesia duncani TaxID=323732 RepID=A0AAD9PJ62_9APIC|nr:Protein FAM32A [Babesia duncani]
MKDLPTDKSYENTIRGSLKLKGKIIMKKKNAVTVIETEVDDSEKLLIPYNPNKNDTAVVDSQSSESDKKIERVKNNPYLTASEKAFKIAQIKRNAKKIDAILAETHRQRVEKFNDKLTKLSEHFDIPKVGPG